MPGIVFVTRYLVVPLGTSETCVQSPQVGASMSYSVFTGELGSPDVAPGLGSALGLADGVVLGSVALPSAGGSLTGVGASPPVVTRSPAVLKMLPFPGIGAGGGAGGSGR